jgi:uncharacterized Zn finger protein
MKPWERASWYPPATKKPPPEHGIKLKKLGSTWWGQRWVGALESVLGGSAGRLARGRSYARAGRTHDLIIKDGKVSAKVTGSAPTPYAISIELTQLPEAAWNAAIAKLAEKAQFAAELLAGHMPQNIDDVFRSVGASLFPRLRSDLATTCSCPDWGDPCKHVAAAHYVLGEAIDGDPFLLFELRGRQRQQVLDALRVARGEDDGDTEGSEASLVPAVTLGMLDAAEYDRGPAALPALHFSFDAPRQPGALLRQLGAPSSWTANGSPGEALAAVVRAAGDAARRIALAEPERAKTPAETAKRVRRVKSAKNQR